MATSTIIGKHFEVSFNRITIFGLQGAHVGDQKWAMSFSFGGTVEGYLLMEVDRAPVLGEITKVIEDDKALGNEHLIDHVLISSRVAARLFLEGALPVDAFKAVHETDESIMLMLPLAGQDRQVKIQSEFTLEYEISTRDSTGAIV